MEKQKSPEISKFEQAIKALQPPTVSDFDLFQEQDLEAKSGAVDSKAKEKSSGKQGIYVKGQQSEQSQQSRQQLQRESLEALEKVSTSDSESSFEWLFYDDFELPENNFDFIDFENEKNEKSTIQEFKQNNDLKMVYSMMMQSLVAPSISSSTVKVKVTLSSASEEEDFVCHQLPNTPPLALPSPSPPSSPLSAANKFKIITSLYHSTAVSELPIPILQSTRSLNPFLDPLSLPYTLTFFVVLAYSATALLQFTAALMRGYCYIWIGAALVDVLIPSMKV